MLFYNVANKVYNLSDYEMESKSNVRDKCKFIIYDFQRKKSDLPNDI